MLFRLLLLAFLLQSTQAMAAIDGRHLFTRYCVACHGDDGNGGVGVPLAMPGFLNHVPDDYLFKTIRNGRQGRVMPAFVDLSDAQINALVRYIRSWSKQPAPVINDKVVKGDAVNGGKLFEQHCATCHGAHGEGGKGTGVTFSRPRDLPIIAPGLNNRGFLTAATDGMIKETVMKGRDGTPMVSFLKQGLTEKQINDIVAYVRSFEQNLPKPESRPEKIPEVLMADSPYSYEETVAAVKKAVVGANFRMIRVQPFEQGFVEANKEDPRKTILYFCNFGMLNEAMAIDPRVGLFLPCRVTVVEQGGKVRLFTINPHAVSVKFNNNELNRICDQMTQMYKSILEEATL